MLRIAFVVVVLGTVAMSGVNAFVSSGANSAYCESVKAAKADVPACK